MIIPMIEYSQPTGARILLRWRSWLVMVLAIGIYSNAFAGAVTDASLGRPSQTLSGQMTITQQMGMLAGNNLFHSFQTFNISDGESANFTTSTSGIQNVISRVTGGSPSLIYGPLTLTPASGAPNFFFINPAGVTFGAGASIDVPGAFHVGTADYVKFADGNFHADLTKASTFSSAAPEAFGFLGTNRASITINEGGTLRSQQLQPISVIAGDIEINYGAILTKGGDIRAVALGQVAQEVGFTGSLPAAYGNLSISDGGSIASGTSSSDNAGYVKVNAGSITIDRQGSHLWTGIGSQAQDGGGNAGGIEVTATGNLSIINGGGISSSTWRGSGNAGSIKVNAKSITIDNTESGTFTGIASNTYTDSSGHAGTVEITAAGNLSIINDSEISSSTWSSGDAGFVKVNAGSIVIDGQGGGHGASIVSQANSSSSGKAGAVEVAATGTLSILAGGSISSSAHSSGNAGSIKVNAGGITIDRTGGSTFTGITSQADTGSGNAGTVEVAAAGNLSITNGGIISSGTYSAGNAGAIKVGAGTLLVDGASSSINASASTESSGQTGSVSIIATDNITLSNGGALSIKNGATVGGPSSLTPTLLSVSAPNITLNNAQITAASTGNVAASNIEINFTNRLFLDPGSITTSSNLGNGGSITIKGGNAIILDNSQITTSVSGTAGNGGDINVSAAALAMNTGFIQANTAASNASGGLVGIDVHLLLPSGNTLFVGGQTPYAFQSGISGFNVIQAAAPTGVSGAIHITSPALDISGSLGGLGAQVIDTGGLGRSPCQTSGGSSLAQTGRGGLPPSAGGLLRAEPVLSPNGNSANSNYDGILVASSNWECM